MTEIEFRDLVLDQFGTDLTFYVETTKYDPDKSALDAIREICEAEWMADAS